MRSTKRWPDSLFAAAAGLAPADRMADRPLGGVVGRLDSREELKLNSILDSDMELDSILDLEADWPTTAATSSTSCGSAWTSDRRRRFRVELPGPRAFRARRCTPAPAAAGRQSQLRAAVASVTLSRHYRNPRRGARGELLPGNNYKMTLVQDALGAGFQGG